MAAKKVLITGAAGGMGRACARLLGMTHDLILADVSAERLNAFADELEADAYTVSARIAGDTCDDAVLAQMVAALGGGLHVGQQACGQGGCAVTVCLCCGEAGSSLCGLAAHASQV